jgi:hypothetical protein
MHLSGGGSLLFNGADETANVLAAAAADRFRRQGWAKRHRRLATSSPFLIRAACEALG